MNFEQARAKADELEKAVSATGRRLQDFPRGGMNLIPDAVKLTAEYRDAKKAFDQAFQALRAHNAWYLKAFKSEIARARSARVGGAGG